MTTPPTPFATERDRYEQWDANGVFTAVPSRSVRMGGDREPFTIVIPPPNVTAVLHMGHGLNTTVQDVIVRWRRMSGDEALYVPGTDHAGIATQNVVEKILRTEGKTRFDLGREGFVARTAAFVEETGGTILEQLRALGISCDWTRTAYTLTPELSRAVREAFVRLHEDGLVYRGHRVIHWCSRCLTSLSDEEAEHKDEAGSLYHIAYPLAEPASGMTSLTVATTRPETLLGDVAVAVNPDDPRYAALIGRRVRLPIADVEIPIIADEYADPAFGTGVVKITPAHDPNDFEVGRRHSLPMPIIMSPSGMMEEGADAAGRVPDGLRGVDRFAARARIVDDLKAQGLLVKVETHNHSVRHCYRCDTVVEPRLSDQWFVRMAPLAQPALAAVRSGAIRLLPERWEAVYINWLEGIRDWNISRQLWWGHRIPVWYCDTCVEQIVSRDDVAACPTCSGPVRQDEDVLDTWFSSWLWPFSTLGWPDEAAPGLRAFYPTDALATAPEILFFWVARMIMGGYHFMGRPPFHTVYLHGTVRDTNHVKMSKSLGNGIDPLDVIAMYGADALRFTVIAGLGMGADVILDPKNLEQSFAPGQRFMTKLRNIGKFILANLGDDPVQPMSAIDGARFTRADRWILGRLDAAIADCDAALGPARPGNGVWQASELRAGLRLNEYAEAARRFVWNELADWYVETTKGRMATSGADRDVARAVLVHAFDAALRLLQPIAPFVTEELWQQLPGRAADGVLAREAWPRQGDQRAGGPAVAGAPEDGQEFELVREAVDAIRQLRSQYAVPQGKVIDAVVIPSRADARRVLEAEAALIGRLTRCTLIVGDAVPPGAAAHAVLAGGTAVAVPLEGLIDVERECKRLRGELEQLEKQLGALTQRLGNEGFISRAPAAVVDAERAKQAEWSVRRDQLTEKVQALCGT